MWLDNFWTDFVFSFVLTKVLQGLLSTGIFFKLNFFREKGREGKKHPYERETLMGCLSLHPDWDQTRN